MQLSHFDAAGQAWMVDVGAKAESERVAVAEGRIAMLPATYAMIKAGTMKKGDVLGVARLAGIMAAKQTGSLIPLCHPLAISAAEVNFAFDDVRHSVVIEATVRITGRTGVEMEALTAVSVAALTIYDMCKAVDKGMEISQIRLMRKSGGRSGEFNRSSE
ncbi:cyclic pyranopterin monophosphate synthase MoaC [Candidatus Electronema sp. PJ]|uniref:cyclic pyranopterin monophosphate synthase MoaC n=1 Tax=Candidatus Electronema sp. PJ TaxID=3401572 RepID=UPI003AA96A80